MKLTIVTTTYNQEKYIGEAIDSMLMQKTKFPFQIVVSDDCSQDRTREILEKYKKKYPEKIKVIKNEKNLGAMENFIHTLAQIKDTEYVALCDGDDFWTDENKLQKQIDFLDNNKDFTICFHKARVFYQNNEKEESIIPQEEKEITTIEDLVSSNYIVANSVVYRWKFNTQNLQEIFPTNIVPGDYYMHLLHAQDGKIKMINEVMSAYRRHEKGIWWSNDNENKEKFTLEYGKKFLNFYNAAEQYIKLPKNCFYEQRKDIIYNIIVFYSKNDKINQWKKEIVSDKDKELFSICMKDIVNRNIWYLEYLVNREQEKKTWESERENYEKKIQYQKKEIENKQKELQIKNKEEEQYIQELERIKNSRWWKLRRIIKGEKENG